MTDADLRRALKFTLLAHHYTDPDAVVIDELCVKHGAARVDLAVVNGNIHGFEIKSNRDNLARLPQQVRLYNLILDQASLVVSQQHLKRSIEIVPEWWGIELAQENIEGIIEFTNLRPPQTNPKTDLFSVIQLLKRDEALQILEDSGEAKGFRSKPRSSIYKKLLQMAYAKDIASEVRNKIRLRITLKSALQPE